MRYSTEANERSSLTAISSSWRYSASVTKVTTRCERARSGEVGGRPLRLRPALSVSVDMYLPVNSTVEPLYRQARKHPIKKSNSRENR